MSSRYSIGIDLGTSNCALSFIDNRHENSPTEILPVPQYANFEALVQRKVLPSFLYFLTDDEAGRIAGAAAEKTGDSPAAADSSAETVAQWRPSRVVGVLAREQSAHAPARVIHSAKSWLCHAGVERQSGILPWGSEAIAAQNKLSPVAVSAAYLNYFRYIWDQVMAKGEHGALFNRQDVVITVPASFDNVAQQLTLDAAREAGFSENVRLLEEPQAAFYAWLERHASRAKILEAFPQLAARPQTVLVCDIGGGTSDFSLFEVEDRGDGERLPGIRRIAVSDHILLGGDNIDLALAHRFEQEMAGSTEDLSIHAWHQLVAQCRTIKERLLDPSDAVAPDQSFHVSVTEGGSSLFAAARSAAASKQDLLDVILEGFFAFCPADARPERGASGLREIGLPYARDAQIMRHLAAFLNGRKVDAILFNGGTVTSTVIRNRIQEQIDQWQPGRVPVMLKNDELHLAVARGAAFFRRELEREQGFSISGGSGHSIYLEVESDRKPPKRRRGKKRRDGDGDGAGPRHVICILPQGTDADQLQRIQPQKLHLLVNKPVRLQPFYSTKREGDSVGDVINFNDRDFQPMAPLQTLAQLPPGAPPPEDGKVQVHLEARLNSLGLLRVDCVSVRRIQDAHPHWRLEFNLRAAETETSGEPADADALKDTGVSTEALDAALAFAEKAFANAGTSEAQSVGRLLKEWEAALGEKRKDWNTALLRRLWEPLADSLTRRSLSPEHELAWVMAAGFVLRPGYGFPFDDARVQRLWFIEELGLAFPREKPIREQRFIQWRRAAGGLSMKQQEQLFDSAIELIREDVKASREAIRMAGALERLPLVKRTELARLLTSQIAQTPNASRNAHLWALGRILSRAPLYGGESSVLPASIVEDCFAQLEPLDWTAPDIQPHITQAFAQAARRVDSRALDLAPEMRERVASRLEAANAKPERIREVREFIPLAEADMQLLFGESLPAGLVAG